MKLIAINSTTGKILMANSGTINETSFRATVESQFPDIPKDKIVIIREGAIVGTLGSSSAKTYSRGSKSLIWKGSFCFPSDAQVLTDQGMKSICDIVPGNMVFTHKGRLRPVLRVSERLYDGEMKRLRTILDGEELVLTPNHHVMGMKNSLLKTSNKYVSSSVPAMELIDNDFILLPKFELTQSEKINEHINKFNNCHINETEEGSFLQITSISSSHYSGKVYDLEVEEDHTYTVNGKAVHNSDLGGYANMNREICLRLGHHGWSVKIDVLPTGMQVDPMTANVLSAMKNTRLPNEHTCPLIVGFTPMPIQARGRKVIFFTMMETQGLHPEFVQRCNSGASEVWVPCKFYEKVFRESGVIKPIKVIPLGVNQNIYTPEAKEPNLTYEDIITCERVNKLPTATRFISLFGWSYRKGADVLCKSFLREFSGDDDAILVIYSRYMGSAAEIHKEFVRQEIKTYYEQEKKERPARIYYCGDEIPIPDLPGCYSSADAFVFCSRGEGFALPVVEAGACGLPVISAYNTAMTEYLDEQVAYLVESSEVAPANDKLTWISGYYTDQKFAVLGEAEINKFGMHMRYVHQNKAEAKAKAELFRQRILSTYTWDACVAKVAKRLSEMA